MYIEIIGKRYGLQFGPVGRSDDDFEAVRNTGGSFDVVDDEDDDEQVKARQHFGFLDG